MVKHVKAKFNFFFYWENICFWIIWQRRKKYVDISYFHFALQDLYPSTMTLDQVLFLQEIGIK